MAQSAMASKTATVDVEAALKQLQAELAAVKQDFAARLASLEAHMTPVPAEEPITPELLAVISAAVTSFLGVKVKIRSVHHMPTPNPWAQSGRAIVQASHNLKR